MLKIVAELLLADQTVTVVLCLFGDFNIRCIDLFQFFPDLGVVEIFLLKMEILGA